MPARSTTSYAVLGLLAVQPWTSSELAKQLRRSLRWFSPPAERRIYDEPERLVEEGQRAARRLVRSHRPAGRPALPERMHLGESTTDPGSWDARAVLAEVVTSARRRA